MTESKGVRTKPGWLFDVIENDGLLAENELVSPNLIKGCFSPGNGFLNQVDALDFIVNQTNQSIADLFTRFG